MNGDLRDLVIHKAQRDPAFREALKADPKKAIHDTFKKAELPSDVKIDVLEESENQAFVVLPMGKVDGQLADEQLEAVSGGGCVPCFGLRARTTP